MQEIAVAGRGAFGTLRGAGAQDMASGAVEARRAVRPRNARGAAVSIRCCPLPFKAWWYWRFRESNKKQPDINSYTHRTSLETKDKLRRSSNIDSAPFSNPSWWQKPFRRCQSSHPSATLGECHTSRHPCTILSKMMSVGRESPYSKVLWMQSTLPGLPV